LDTLLREKKTPRRKEEGAVIKEAKAVKGTETGRILLTKGEREAPRKQ